MPAPEQPAEPAGPADPLAALDQIADAARLRSRRLADGVVTIIADGSGLDAAGREALEQRLRSAALALSGVSEARIALHAERRAPRLVAIGSGKGGVGKSTIAANLAVALARRGHRIGLIDADIHGPSQPLLMGAPERPEARDKQLVPVEAHGVAMLSIGQLVPAGQALAWRGPMIAGALGQLIDGDWSGCDLILVDLPPGTGDIQLSLVSKARPVGALIVSTPQDLALIDAARAVDLFRKTQVPVLGIIENMAGYSCPHCGESSDPFGSGGAQAAAAELGIAFLGRLPLSASLRLASDRGEPPAGGSGEAAEQFARLGERLIEQLDTLGS